MKLAFFLIAFSLVLLRVYFAWSEHGSKKTNTSTVTISSDNDYEQINYSGQIKLNEDETAIERMSPGSYLKYHKNKRKLIAESNLRGEITFELYEGDEKLAFNGNGKRLIEEAIQEMISYGYNANERMDRIYKKGGASALLKELKNLKLDNIKTMYLNRIFSDDSLTESLLAETITTVGALGSDNDKGNYLKKIRSADLKDPQVIQAYSRAVRRIGSDVEKENVLKHLIEQRISEETFAGTINIIEHIGSEMQKANLLLLVIDKQDLTEDHFEKILEVIESMGAEREKGNLYKKLVEEKSLTEQQWIALLKKIAKITSDTDKSNLLMYAAKKMPMSEKLKATYLKVAKTINSDEEFRRSSSALQ